MWRLREMNRANCHGFGFVIDLNADTVAIPDGWQILAQNALVDGFVVEGPTAGGHNAPPRGALTLDGHGEPVYGPRDVPDLEQIRNLGLPFWLAGSYGDTMMIEKAISLGAQGVQVGTAFAFCDESGMAPELKASVLLASRSRL